VRGSWLSFRRLWQACRRRFFPVSMTAAPAPDLSCTPSPFSSVASPEPHASVLPPGISQLCPHTYLFSSSQPPPGDGTLSSAFPLARHSLPSWGRCLYSCRFPRILLTGSFNCVARLYPTDMPCILRPTRIAFFEAPILGPEKELVPPTACSRS